MINEEKKRALLFVLVEKIYFQNPGLIRNDQETAKLVRGYIDFVVEQNHKRTQKKWSQHTNSDFEHFDSGRRIRPLSSLSIETLRKYIGYLWASDAIVPFLEFKSCQEVDD